MTINKTTEDICNAIRGLGRLDTLIWHDNVTGAYADTLFHDTDVIFEILTETLNGMYKELNNAE